MAISGALLSSCSSCFYLLPFMVVAFAFSPVILFYLKLALFGIQFAVFCTLTVLISLRSPGEARNLNRAIKYFGWMTKVWQIKFNIKGLENMKEDSNYIVMANHQSAWDTVAMMEVMPQNTRVMVKKEISYTPFIGLVAWVHGAIFVDRYNNTKAVNVLKDAVAQIRKEKCSVWVFPEGTRHHGETLLPFKKGGFHLAQQSEVPILPMVISNYENIVNFGERRFLTGTIDITIFPPIPTKGLDPSDVNDLLKKVRNQMCDEYEPRNNNMASREQ